MEPLLILFSKFSELLAEVFILGLYHLVERGGQSE